MNNCQLPGHRQDSALAGGISKLWGGASHQRHNTGGIDDASIGLLVPPQAEHGVLGAVPHTLDVNIVCHIPDLLGCIDCISVISVHDASIVEDNIQSTPRIQRIDHSLYICFV